MLEPAADRAMDPVDTDAGAPRPLILIVDDYQVSRMMYASFLSVSGFRVAEAGDGLEAVEKAETLLPNLILMDLSLPGIDGWEASRRVKSDPRTCHIPIVILTAHTVSRNQPHPSCDDVVTKPCSLDDLISCINRFVARPGPQNARP
jgi:CheY-like chemotaxis protein